MDIRSLLSDSSKKLINLDENPPIKIEIKGYDPLLLARKKHYISQREKKKGFIRKSSYNILNFDKKTQGRPFNDNLNARFLFFQNIESLISNLLNLKTNRIENVSFPCPPSPQSNSSSRRSSTSSSSTDSMTSNSSKSPTISNLVNNYSINTNFIINYDNLLIENFINSHTYKSNDYITQSIEFQNFNNSNLNIIVELSKIFNCESLSFIKIIRNNKGKLIKFEIISSNNHPNLPFDINFIKKFITYPRYKSKMKIYLIKGEFERKLWFYNDIRMLIWDLEHLDMKDKKILINNNILNN